MSWFGKLLGGAVGFAIGGPIGALIGVALGHHIDRGVERPRGALDEWDALAPNARERTQSAFFTAVFSVMGHLTKADGTVTADEIRLATRVMDEMRLTPAQRRVAQRLFREGKAPDFPLDGVLDQLRRECHRSRDLIAMFVEILMHAAYADGALHPSERALLAYVGRRLGLGDAALAHIEAMVRAQWEMRGSAASDAAPRERLAEAYAVLGVDATSSDADVKRAYRRLMSRHHPDKLVSKGLPEEMVRIATEKTQEIKLAYDRVKDARGW